MLTAKVVVPLPAFDQIHRSMIERIEKYPVTLICAPPGYVLTESLAAGIFEREWPVTWCRLAVEDGDPGILLLSLIQSLQQLAPEVGRGTIKRMRQQPGPVNGWPQLFAALASEAAGLLPHPCWLVLEDVQFLQNQCSTLELLVMHFLSLLPDGVHTVLVASSTLHCTTVFSRTPMIGENELRIDPFTGQNVTAEWISDFSTNDVLRLVQLIKGQAGALTGVLSAGRLIGSARVMQIIRSSNSTEDLLTQIARACLLTQNGSAVESLAVSQHLEYSHPRIVQAVLLGIETPEGPWWQPLEGGWKYLRPL
jgi:hypothetical protein